MKTRFLAQASIIAAVYAVLTIVLMAFSYGPVQVRVAEALCILPLFTPAAIPGLAVGCFIANIFSPAGLPDLIFGSLATLIGAVGVYAFRKRPMLAPLCPVLSNAVIVGSMLRITTGTNLSIFACMAWVAVGELISCYLIGYPLYRLLRLHPDIFEL